MIRVLFVCLGNICRSPAAEGVLKKKIKDLKIESQFFIDSAGTSAYHNGEEADGRMQFHAEKRGYILESLSRPLTPDDCVNFDYILTMDESNYENTLKICSEKNIMEKIHPFTSFCLKHSLTEVPDPYYKGEQGFEWVMDIIEDGCDGFLDYLKQNGVI